MGISLSLSFYLETSSVLKILGGKIFVCVPPLNVYSPAAPMFGSPEMKH
jgi:hypothetical protein